MKSAKLIVALLFVICSAAASFAADAGAITAINAVVKAHTKEVVESVYVEKIVGEYALAIVSVKGGDGGIAYLKNSGSGWAVLHYGNALPEAALTALGVPEECATKLAD